MSWRNHAVPGFLVAVLLVHAFHIFSTAYLNINGAYAWRQADVLSHILGFLPDSGFAPHERFVLGAFQIYDIPIYQWIIAKIAYLYQAPPLVVARLFNAVLITVCLAATARMVDQRAGRAAAFIFLFLSLFSPLLVHYFSTPLPDLLAMALAAAGTAALVSPKAGWRATQLALVTLHIATLIKSPVPFAFAAFTATLIVTTRPRAEWRTAGWVLLSLAPTALLAEALRSVLLERPLGLLAQDPGWYFGTLEQRLSSEVWAVILDRFQGWWQIDYLPMYAGAVALSMLTAQGRRIWPLHLAFAVSFLATWLVFTNVNFIHDYYQLPICLLGLAALAGALGNLVTDGAGRGPALAGLLTLLIPVFLLPSLSTKTLSDKNPNAITATMAEALAGEEIFLIVGQPKPSPTVAGAVATRFAGASRAAFEADCPSYLAQYRAVLVLGTSECLSTRRGVFDTYLERPGMVFVRQR